MQWPFTFSEYVSQFVENAVECAGKIISITDCIPN